MQGFFSANMRHMSTTCRAAKKQEVEEDDSSTDTKVL